MRFSAPATSSVRFAEGVQLETALTGAPALAEAAAPGATALALASADFDEDGVPDLVASYASSAGSTMRLYRGNADAIFPDGRGAFASRITGSWFRRRAPSGVDAPFLPGARAFGTPVRPDFVAAGDFDADGYMDVAIAERGGSSIALLAGDGAGRLAAGITVSLPGAVTAVACGEVNRAGGLADLAVGVEGPAGPRLLVFEGPTGALASEPEELSVRAPVTAIATGRLGGDGALDLAVAAGSRLLVVEGRDRRLSIAAPNRPAVGPASVTAVADLGGVVTALAAGDFAGDNGQEVAALLADGTVRVASRGVRWTTLALSSAAMPGADALVAARLSSRPGDGLVALDAAAHSLHVVVPGRGAAKAETAEFDADLEVAAVLPMRLSPDAIDDLVVVTRDGPAPIVARSTTTATFVVTNTNDAGDGSLRGAMEAANASPGADSIVFDIGPDYWTITPASPLPELTEAVTIDATVPPTGGGEQGIFVDGSATAASPDDLVNGVVLSGGNSVVRGLQVGNFTDSGILIQTNGNYRVEACFVGNDGTNAFPNAAGVGVIGATNVTVGGTSPDALNFLCGNGHQGCVFAPGGDTSGSAVLLNMIGIAADGVSNLGNVRAGVGVISSGVTVGAPGAGNYIAGNTFNGVTVLPAESDIDSVVIQANRIGTVADGTEALPNDTNGVQVFGGDMITIGGTSPGTGNLISGSGLSGIRIFFPTNLVVQGNAIGTDVTKSYALPNSGDGIFSLGGGITIGGVGVSNVISGNGGMGVQLFGDACVVQNNLVGTDGSGTAAVPNLAGGIGVGGSGCLIGGALPNVVSGNGNPEGGTGIGVDGGENTVAGNLVGLASDGTPLGNIGAGVAFGGWNNRLVNCQIAHNGDSGASAGGSDNAVLDNSIRSNGTHGVSLDGGSNNRISRNLISGNALSGVWIHGYAENLFATNNVVSENRIGTTADGASPFPNGENGVTVDDAADNRVERNLIAFNAGHGIDVRGPLAFGDAVLANSIHSNGGLGIALDGAFVPNDALDADDGPNRLQNFPALASATRVGPRVGIQGQLSGAPHTTYVVQFFSSAVGCDASGYGEGQTYLGQFTVRTNAAGVAPLTVVLPASLPPGTPVTATATDSGNNTSGFSACVPVALRRTDP